MNSRRNVLFGTVILFLCCLACYAQDRGSITGVVSDPTGAAVPDATVTAANESTGRVQTTRSTSAGVYTLPELPSGTYKVTAEKTGFKLEVAEKVRVVVNTATRHDFSMSIGSLTQVVEVKAAAALLQTDRTDTGMAMNGNQISDLPLSLTGGVRTNTQFVLLSPGVVNSGGMDTNNLSTKINGGLLSEQSQLLDGGESQSTRVNDAWFAPVGVDTIQEFKVITGSMSAEYGRTGNGVQNFVTKSGTNRFHGSAFEYNRNPVFNSRRFFDKNTPINKQNDFGGTIGGPIVRDKLHFFFGYEDSRYMGAGASGYASVPSMAVRNGDFRQFVDSKGKMIPIYDPATTRIEGGKVVRDQMSCNGVLNTICPDRLDPQAKAVLSMVPAPTLPGDFNNIPNVGVSGSIVRSWMTKIDWNKGTSHHLSAMFSRYTTGAPAQFGPIPGPLGANFAGTWDNRFFRLGYDYIIRPTLLNHLMIGSNWELQMEYSSLYNRQGDAKMTVEQQKAIQLKGVPFRDFSPTVYNVSGYNQWNYWTYTNSPMRTLDIKDTLTWMRGRQNIKVGFQRTMALYSRWDCNNCSGEADFAASVTGLPGASFTTGSSFAAFYLGLPSSMSYITGNFSHQSAPNYSWFFQDDIKVSRKLTINAGLRYDLPIALSEKYGNWSFADISKPNPAADGLLGALTFLGNGPGRLGRNRYVDYRTNAWGPRLGFAYQVTPTTVLRMGGGLYYTGVRTYASGGDHKSGFSSQQNLPQPNSYDPAGSLAVGMPAPTPSPIIDPGVCTLGYTVGPSCNPGLWFPYSGKVPRIGSWNATVERRFGTNTLVRLAYVGSAAVHMGATIENINQLDPKYLSLGSLLEQPINSPAAVAAGIKKPYASFPDSRGVNQALRPYPMYSSISSQGADRSGHSRYHSMQLSLEKQLSNGLWAQAAYTWSKTIATSDSDGTTPAIFGGQGNTGVQDQYNRIAEKSIAASDIPQRLAFAYIYELPVGRGKRLLSNPHPVVNGILGGWRVTGFHQYQSGNPLFITSNQRNGLFGQAVRPNVVLGQRYINPAWTGDPNAKDASGKIIPYINPNAFSRITAYTCCGNAPRYFSYLRNPGWMSEDLSLMKDFFLWSEQRKLTFSANFFNAFNRHILGSAYGTGQSPNPQLEAATFGVMSAQGNPAREIQFMLRLIF